jgi:hypothetical protein
MYALISRRFRSIGDLDVYRRNARLSATPNRSAIWLPSIPRLFFSDSICSALGGS